MVRAKTPVRSAADFMPQGRLSLPTLREASKTCRGCELHKLGTQTVFGEGRGNADVFFVGEQPGDQEDLAGRPFVGPAGRLLDKALEEARIDRKKVYVTNAVKHFKWVQRGKRRIHSRPSAREVRACQPWLRAELQVVKPKVLVFLGATAAQSLLGSQFRVTQHRGDVFESQWSANTMAIVHPSSILRAPDETSRRQAYAEFVADLKQVATVLARARKK